MFRAFATGLVATALSATSAGVALSQDPGQFSGPIPTLTTAPIPCACGLQHPGEPCLGACQPAMQGVDCQWSCGSAGRWSDMRPMEFQTYAQGEYIGPPRLAHLAVYRLRPGDQLQLVFLLMQRETKGPYRLMIGDEVIVTSITADEELQLGTLERGNRIQPDGTITVKMLGQIHAAGLTIDQLRETLEQQYTRYYPRPAIDVIPVRTNSVAQEIRNAVGGASSFQGQLLSITVAPDGTIRLPELGEVRVQGLSLEELKRELNHRYGNKGIALEVEPILSQQAPHFVHVLGEVAAPNRVQLDGPTTVMGAIAAAGGWQPGANLRQVVIFRRAEDWRLISTMVDLRGALLGQRPTPADEIWLRDGDVVVIPPTPIKLFDNFVQQVFTNGVYGVVPFGGVSIQIGDED